MLKWERVKLWNWTGFRNRDDQLLIVLSLIIGIVVGLTVVAFILLTGRLAARMYPPGAAAWRRVLIPAIGSLLTGYLLYRYFPNARGSGIPQTKFALFIQDGYISLRTVLGKFVCCSASLASGIALGREGPSVQIGAGIASVIGRRFGLGPTNLKALVPVGCSAALAAAFNTPIAAVLFSLEEILGDLHAPVLGSVVISSATSWIVLHLILGDAPLFHVPAYQVVNPFEFGIYAVLGIVGGLGSVCFVKLLLNLRMWFGRLPKWTVWMQPAVGGLLVGLLGWRLPEVLGVGYDYVDRVLGGDFPLKTVALLAVLKIVATPVCYSSGNAGGIFGPSLFIGAMFGGTVGSVAHMLFPGATANPGAYALVGMGTAFAGIVRTPLTSVIMIFEMTRDYSIIVPLMISNLISFFISQQLQREPIYEALALQEGVYLPTGESRAELAGIRVSQVMHADAEPLSSNADLASAKRRLAEQNHNSWPVGERNYLRGVISVPQLDMAPSGANTVGDLIETDGKYIYIHPDHPVSYALERMGAASVDVLPVVSRADIRQMQGIVSLGDVLAAYGLAREAAVIPDMASTADPANGKVARPLRIFVVLTMIIAGLWVLDWSLERTELSELQAEAQRAYVEGSRLFKEGKLEPAIDLLLRAHALERKNAGYGLTLVDALVVSGKTDEAEPLLDEILQRESNDGRANLSAARLMAAKGRVVDAESYYHRAIYGAWPNQAGSSPRAARMELVDFLLKHGQKEALLAELLPLQEEAGKDAALQKRIANLFLVAGSAQRAVDAYRSLLEQFPNDADAYAGLGEAELFRGQYRAAVAAFVAAFRHPPNDPLVRRRMEFASLMAGLDPTPRQLSSFEKYRRSLHIVELVRGSYEKCNPGQLEPPSTEKLPTHVTNEMAEEKLALAEQMWRARTKACGVSTSAEEEPLRLIMAKLAQ